MSLLFTLHLLIFFVIVIIVEALFTNVLSSGYVFIVYTSFTNIFVIISLLLKFHLVTFYYLLFNYKFLLS